MKSSQTLRDATPVTYQDVDQSRRPIASLVAAGWIVQIFAYIAIGLWVFFDGEFAALARTAFDRLALSSSATENTFLGMGFPARVWILRVLVAAASLSFLLAIIGLAIGSQSQRRVTTWLALTAILAGWLALFTTWPEVAWQGQQWRMAHRIERFAPLVKSLTSHWPTSDGEAPGLGAFMAYPINDPSMLLIIARPQEVDAPQFVSVERSKKGAIRFELTGAESGAWLEWHPDGDQPSSFVGGLETDYVLERSAPIGNGWYVTRYLARYPSNQD